MHLITAVWSAEAGFIRDALSGAPLPAGLAAAVLALGGAAVWWAVRRG